MCPRHEGQGICRRTNEDLIDIRKVKHSCRQFCPRGAAYARQAVNRDCAKEHKEQSRVEPYETAHIKILKANAAFLRLGQ